MVERSPILERLDAVSSDDVSFPEAEELAQELCRHLNELGEGRRMEEIVKLAHHPSTRPLLALMTDTIRKRPELYLREAERWEAQRRETNLRRLGEARRALDGLDLDLAKGLMKRIDGRFLSDSQQEERDQILLDISARSMEMESLSESIDELVASKDPDRTDRPFWRRWLG